MRSTGMEEAEERIIIGGRKINNLRYADDTTRIAANITDLPNQILNVKSSSEEAGLFLNIKCQRLCQLQKFNLADEELEVVSSFNFVGSMKTEDGYCKENRRKRLALGFGLSSSGIGLDKIWKRIDCEWRQKSGWWRRWLSQRQCMVLKLKIEAFENWFGQKMVRMS
jgi:hypothetical protein